jgi:hypothetical protein
VVARETLHAVEGPTFLALGVEADSPLLAVFVVGAFLKSNLIAKGFEFVQQSVIRGPGGRSLSQTIAGKMVSGQLLPGGFIAVATEFVVAYLRSKKYVLRADGPQTDAAVERAKNGLLHS